jgi:DNA-binding PadR family transcriptional regulator
VRKFGGPAQGSIVRRTDTTCLLRPEDDLTMTELTAAQVLALSALAEGRPMTTAELARAVADMGMHLGGEYAAATVRSLTEQGMAERTPAASLGKYRITAHGRAWLTSHTSSEESES